MKNMICAAQFAAPYEGNFILSLKKLEIELIRLGMTVHCVLPNKCRYTPWIDEFKKIEAYILQMMLLDQVLLCHN